MPPVNEKMDTEENKTGIDEIAAVCSDCGNCLFACPVYNAELLEPTSPRGKVNLIKWLRDGRLKPDRLNKKFIYQCALCGSCQYICTKGVQFVNMMIDYRTAAAGGKKIPFFKKIVLRLYHSIVFKKFAFLVDILAKTPLQKKLAIPRRRKANIRSLYSKKPAQSQYDILFFPGCVLSYFYPEVIKKTVSFIRTKGFSVVMPRGMVCCGFPYLSQGWKKRFFSFMKKNKDIFSQYRFKYLVVPCGTGVMTFKNYYNLEDKNIEIFELTDFFYRFIQDAVVDIDGFKTSTGKITFHDPCHHLKSLGIAKEPRFFMKQLGENFVDDQSALCCGFGGIFSVGFPSTARKILKRKHDTMKELGAGTVITACPGCYMHLKENLSTNKDMDVKFFIDLFLPQDRDSSGPLDSSGH